MLAVAEFAVDSGQAPPDMAKAIRTPVWGASGTLKLTVEDGVLSVEGESNCRPLSQKRISEHAKASDLKLRWRLLRRRSRLSRFLRAELMHPHHDAELRVKDRSILIVTIAGFCFHENQGVNTCQLAWRHLLSRTFR